MRYNVSNVPVFKFIPMRATKIDCVIHKLLIAALLGSRLLCTYLFLHL